MRALDEMMRAYIRHDLSSRQYLRMELILQLPPLLESVSREGMRVQETYIVDVGGLLHVDVRLLPRSVREDTDCDFRACHRVFILL
jgi:hypothetical protein